MTIEAVAERLLPCPFCGGPATINHGATDDYDVGCRSRDCFGPRTSPYGFSQDAISAWSGAGVVVYPSDITDDELGNIAIDQSRPIPERAMAAELFRWRTASALSSTNTTESDHG